SHASEQSRPDESGQNDGRRFQHRQNVGGRQHRTARNSGVFRRHELTTLRFTVISRSTITTSSQRPSRRAWFSYTPTSRNPCLRQSARLPSLKGKMRNSSSHNPSRSASLSRAASNASPTPRRLQSRRTYNENSPMPR